MTTQPPLLLFELLSNKKLNPGALMLHISPEEGDSQIPLLVQDETFIAITKAVPCLLPAGYAETLSPEALFALQAAGCTLVAENEICRVNGVTPKPEFTGTAQWMTGNWYLAQPEKPPVNQTASRLLELKLLQMVANDAETREIESVFRRDPVLAYHLLRLVNSLGMTRNISSFSQAILILGRQQLKRWINLMLFAANRNDHRAAMLMARVAVRAHTMELLAKALGMDAAAREQAFMVGMFSLLGVLFGMPLDQVLVPLNLSEAISSAVLKNSGEYGNMKKLVETAETLGHEALLSMINQMPGLSVDEFNKAILAAHLWMCSITTDKDANH